MSDAGSLQLNNLTLAYDTTIAVDSLDLTVGSGELLALLGPSGCGKTTTMRAIAGLMRARSGSIVLDGADITATPANRRPVGLVFQSYALFPHLNVFENVAFGLRLKRMPKSDVESRVVSGLEGVGLESFSQRMPAELSGGQQQRVALARAMVMEPKVLLLDEPLSNLDARLRLEMRTELQRVQKASGITMIFVTHDQSEALALADRIVVMRDGRIEQTGTPEEIYNHPRTAFVAEFVGFENVFEIQGGQLSGASGPAALSTSPPPEAKALAWRPGAVEIGKGPFEGEVLGTSFAGRSREYLLSSNLGPIKAELAADAPAHELGELVAFDLPVAKAAALAGHG